MNHQSDDRTREAPTPMCSRRSFMRVAAASGGAGLLSAGLLPTIVQARAGSQSQIVLPPATPDIAPFKVHVPQAALQDLRQRKPTPRLNRSWKRCYGCLSGRRVQNFRSSQPSS